MSRWCLQTVLHCWSVALAGLLIAACATKGIVMHSFEFDARRDSPDVEILDYRYGDSKNPGARAPEWALKQGKVPQATATGGELRRADELYVKWRVRSTGEVHEDTVDLKRRLPDDITNHTVYFLIRGRQLYVYLITPERRAANAPPADGPGIYQHRRVIAVYPDSPR
jgi:hypothetical protein